MRVVYTNQAAEWNGAVNCVHCALSKTTFFLLLPSSAVQNKSIKEDSCCFGPNTQIVCENSGADNVLEKEGKDDEDDDKALILWPSYRQCA